MKKKGTRFLSLLLCTSMLAVFPAMPVVADTTVAGEDTATEINAEDLTTPVGTEDAGNPADMPEVEDISLEAEETETDIADEKESVVTPDAEGSDATLTDAEESVAATAEEGGDEGEPSSNTYNVLDYGADATGQADSSVAFNDALKEANNTDEVVTIVIPAGTYRADFSIFVYSNTVIEADPSAVIISEHEGAIIKGAHLGNDGLRCRKEDPDYIKDKTYVCDHAEYDAEGNCYSLVENVTIRGGVWDANGNADKDCQCILFRHANNITLDNVIVQHATNHAVNISGSKNITVTNSTFKDPVKYTGTSKDFWGDHEVGDAKRYKFIEALHFDFCSQEAEAAAWPIDNAPCQNVTVDGCHFTNVYSGVGTHHLNSKPAKSVAITNCDFEGLKSGNTADEHGCAVYFKSLNGLTISQCTVGTCRSLTELVEVTGLDINNNKVGTESGQKITYNGLALTDCTGKVQSNEFNKGKTTGMTNGIAVAGSKSSVTISGNSFDTCSEQGINMTAGTATISNNIINNTQKAGILVQGKATATLSGNNTITNTAMGNTSAATYYGMTVKGNSTATGTMPTITGTKGGGVRIEASKAVLTGGKITSPVKEGIAIVNASAGTSVSGTTVATPKGDNGIYIGSSSNVVKLSNCTVTSPAKYGIMVASSKATVTGNTVSSPVNNGIHLKNALAGTTVSQNKVTDGKGRGIAAENSATTTINKNTVTDCVNDGIFASSTTAKIEDNTSVSSNKDTSTKDIRMIKCASGSTLKGNTYGTRGFLVDANSKVTGGSNTSKYLVISGVSDKNETGSAITQKPTVKIVNSANGVNITLKEGRDYSISYKNNVNPGTATIVFKDPTPFTKGGVNPYYPATTSKTFTIKAVAKTSISKATVSGVTNKAYTGKAQTQNPVVKLNGKTLKNGTDYTVKYANNVKVGTATMTITGKGTYTGSIKKTFKITESKIKINGITAAKHEIGKVTFAWSKKSGTTGSWTIQYRWRKIGGTNSWTKWTTKTFKVSTLQTVINVPRNYCIEVRGKGSGDADWSKSIFTTPAGGAYQSMKYVHVKNVATNKRITSITLKKGQTVKLQPDYDYPVKNYTQRPRLYPNHMFYDDADTSIISIRNDRTGKAYDGAMVDGTVTVKGLKAGTTTIVCRSPNGRTMNLKVTVK